MHERNYPTHDLKLVAVIFALRTWIHYFDGNDFIFLPDHKRRKYIFTQKDLNTRHRRWLELLSEYEIDILYHEGKANVVADTVSMRPIRGSVGMASVTLIYTTRRHLMGMMARLSIQSSILELIRAS